MLKRDDIVEGMYLVTTQENFFNSKNSTKSFPAGSIFKVKKLTKDRTNPDLYLFDDNNNVWVENNFKRILSIIDRLTDANNTDTILHDSKKNNEELLKEIKKLAGTDNLQPIIELLGENPQFLDTSKNVKALMAYAIKSQKVEVLNYGFNNNWFVKINWNENIITVNYSGLTPLFYAIKNSNKNVQEVLMLNGASLDNKMTANYDTSISKSLILTMDEMKNIVSLARTVDIINLHDKFNAIMPDRKNKIKSSNKIKI